MARGRNSNWSLRPRAPIPYVLLESHAWIAISAPARHVFLRLVIEYGKHKGGENGALPCTFKDFEDYGVGGNQIARSIRELVAVGLIEVARKGVAGNADHRRAALYRITCFAQARDGSKDGTHDYERVKSAEEAEALVAAARNNVNARDIANGHKSVSAKKQKPALQSGGEIAHFPPSNRRGQAPPSNRRALSIFRPISGPLGR